MVGRKIYYELTTGDPILIVPEKHGQNAINTTKEQDFQMYDVLTARNPDAIGLIQLEYGQYSAEFQSARSVHVNPETQELQFEYPEYHPPLTVQVETLRAESEQLKQKANEIDELRDEDLEIKLALAELAELLVGGVD
jgi:16S rRNA U1498 N3-methylase RsmE